MPRPPVLPALDWRAIFDSGIEFDAWLATADHPHLRDAMAESANQLTLAPKWKLRSPRCPQTCT